MKAENSKEIRRRESGKNIWLESSAKDLSDFAAHVVNYEILADEQSVGQEMFRELQTIAREKTGDIVMVLLGGRGAQALHKLLGEKAKTDEIDALLSRLRVFTQDALAPLRMNNSLSFVRDLKGFWAKTFSQK